MSPYTAPSAETVVRVSTASSSLACTGTILAENTSRVALSAHCVVDRSGNPIPGVTVWHAGAPYRPVRALISERFFTDATDASASDDLPRDDVYADAERPAPVGDAAVLVLAAALPGPGVQLDGSFSDPVITLGLQYVDPDGYPYPDLRTQKDRDRGAERHVLTACLYDQRRLERADGYVRIPCRFLPGGSGGPTLWTDDTGRHHLAGITSQLITSETGRPLANDVTPVAAIAEIVTGAVPVRVVSW